MRILLLAIFLFVVQLPTADAGPKEDALAVLDKPIDADAIAHWLSVALEPASLSLSCSSSRQSASRNLPRNTTDNAFTGNKKPPRGQIHWPSEPKAPPGTKACTCGCWISVCDQVCNNNVAAISPPSQRGLRANSSSVSAAAANNSA